MTEYLIKVQYYAYKNPRWVVADEDLKSWQYIQKSRKKASRFNVFDDAETIAASLRNNHCTVEVVEAF